MNWTLINSLFGAQRQKAHWNLTNSYPNSSTPTPERLAMKKNEREEKSEEPISKQEESKWYSRIEIKTEEEPSVVTHIYIDGKELHGIRSYELKQSAGAEAVLTIDLNALDISIDNPKVRLRQNGLSGDIKIVRKNGTSREIP